MEYYDRLSNILKWSNNKSYNARCEKLNINDNTKYKIHPLLSYLNSFFTLYIISALLYEIVTYSNFFQTTLYRI